MAFDYAPLAATAFELVTEFGRPVTLRRLATTPPDPDKPWLGPVDPRAAPAATLQVSAAFVDPSSARDLGLDAQITDWLKRAQQIAIIASSEDLNNYSEMLDGADVWRVVGVSTQRPAATALIHFVGVDR